MANGTAERAAEMKQPTDAMGDDCWQIRAANICHWLMTPYDIPGWTWLWMKAESFFVMQCHDNHPEHWEDL
jgi:hypothetical protein